MFDADVDSLFDVAVADSFVDYDAHCGFCDIVNDTRFSVVDFVRHAVVLVKKNSLNYERKRKYEPFLNGSVGFDVNDVSDSKDSLATLLRI